METVESRSTENTGNYASFARVMSTTKDGEASSISNLDGQREATKQYEAPFDPNLTCPNCDKMFRCGEIQIYKKHVHTCSDS